jgi:hypothetical protein
MRQVLRWLARLQGPCLWRHAPDPLFAHTVGGAAVWECRRCQQQWLRRIT